MVRGKKWPAVIYVRWRTDADSRWCDSSRSTAELTWSLVQTRRGFTADLNFYRS